MQPPFTQISEQARHFTTLDDYSLDNKKHLAVPPGAVIDEILLLMINNVFQFGDTDWLQKVRTAMGAQPAPPWATIFFGIHKEAVLAHFGDMLQLYHCFIDNFLDIWIVNPDPAKDHRQWTAFNYYLIVAVS